MANPLFTKNFIAGAAIAKYRIVKFGADDDHVIQASLPADALLGVSDNLGAASGERIDIILSGIAEVEFAANVNRGALITSDADGKAVQCSPGTGINNRMIGIAMVGSAAGDIAPVLLNLGSVQG